jgi:hypothetical protein
LADPNWFYSSTAQSAAAIVAIVGGFVTSRLLGLSAERSTLQNELSDKEFRLRTLQKRTNRLKDDLQRLDARHGLWRMDVTHYGKPIPELGQLRAENTDLQDLDPAIVQEVYEELRLRLEAAFTFVENHENLITADDSSFHRWVSKHHLSTEGLDRDLASNAFEDVAKARKAQAREEARKRLPFGIQMPDLSLPSIALSTPPDMRNVPDPKERIREERRALAAQEEVLDGDIGHLRERLAAFRYPPNILWGLGVLGYLALGSVIFPLALLPADIQHDALKWTVLALFSSGVLALFVYVAAQTLDLRGIVRLLRRNHA